MAKTKGLTFRLDSLDWQGGVSDSFAETPLGLLATPLKVEEIAEVEWTIVFENFITVIPIENETQIKYWLKIPERIREKVRKYSEEIFPFESKDISDRFLLAYSVESPAEKYIGFTFESVLHSSKLPLYVYTQAKVNTEQNIKEFLENYLDDIYKLDIENIVAEEDNTSIFKKVLQIFKPK